MPAPKSARLLALRALRKIEREGAFSNRALDAELEANPGMDPRDRGLATALVYGVLRHEGRLDHHINALAHNPKRIKGELRSILRIAVFELREMAHPIHVVSSEAAKLVKRLDPRGRLRGLVTALLKGVDRGGADHDAGLDKAKPVDALRLRWSVPGWLARRWLRELGAETAIARAKALGSAPPVDLRVDLSRFTAAEIREVLSTDHPTIQIEAADPAHPQCLRTRSGGDVFYGPTYERGAIAVQSLGSQQAAIALAKAMPLKGRRVLDACAGMGTKTVQLAELMEREGELLALDIDARKLAQLNTHAQRAALEVPGFNLRTLELDLAAAGDEPGEAPQLFEADGDAALADAILLDAPCTGLGDLARHPELRTRVRPEQLLACAALQARLLRTCARLLAPGGHLVYAVCSLEAEEGRDLVRTLAPELGLEICDESHWTPETHACDGFFHATLRKPAAC